MLRFVTILLCCVFVVVVFIVVAVVVVGSGNVINVVGGGGTSSAGYLDGLGTVALFRAPLSVAPSIAVAQAFYVVDSANSIIRFISPTGILLCGNDVSIYLSIYLSMVIVHTAILNRNPTILQA